MHLVASFNNGVSWMGNSLSKIILNCKFYGGEECELIILKEESEQKTKIISQIFGIITAFSNRYRQKSTSYFL